MITPEQKAAGMARHYRARRITGWLLALAALLAAASAFASTTWTMSNGGGFTVTGVSLPDTPVQSDVQAWWDTQTSCGAGSVRNYSLSSSSMFFIASGCSGDFALNGTLTAGTVGGGASSPSASNVNWSKTSHVGQVLLVCVCCIAGMIGYRSGSVV